MRDPDLAGLTVPRLRALAAELGVTLPPRPTKADMIAAIERARGAQAARAARSGAKPKAAAGKGTSKARTGARKAAPAKGSAPAKKARASVERGAKRAAPPAFNPAAAAPETPPPPPPLPREYGEDRLVVMPRDPGTAFAYWEVAADHARDALADAGRDARLALRVYDTRGPALERWRDFDAGERVGRRYLDLEGAARDVVAELGALAADGTFVPVARSRTVHLPASQASQLEDRVFRLFGAIDTPAAWHSGTGLVVAGVLGDASALGSSAELAGGALGSSADLASSSALPSSPLRSSSPGGS